MEAPGLAKGRVCVSTVSGFDLALSEQVNESVARDRLAKKCYKTSGAQTRK